MSKEVITEAQKPAPLFKTYFTNPEWLNVDMVDWVASYLKSGRNVAHYPYLTQIKLMWSALYTSFNYSVKRTSLWAVVQSDYFLMNGFVAIMTTQSLLTKGLLSSVLSFAGGNHQSTFQVALGDLASRYHAFIWNTPFCYFDFHSAIRQVIKDFRTAEVRTVADYVLLIMALCDLSQKALISYPLAWWFSLDGNQSDPLVNCTVRMKPGYQLDNSKTEWSVKAVSGDNPVEPLDIKTKLRRGKIFLKVWKELTDKLTFTSVEGNREIQVKTVFKESAQVNKFVEANSFTLLWQGYNGFSEHTAEFQVGVKSFYEFNKQVEQSGGSVKFVHDF